MTESAPVEIRPANDGRVSIVILNRPHVLNALNTDMALALERVLDEISENERCRAVILTGAGDRAFCAGGDLKERAGMTQRQWFHQHRIFERAFWKIRTLRRPVFAAVNGIAAGGGLEMAMSTDFMISSDNARFGQPEVSRGLQPGAGGTQLLPRRIPRGMAMQLLMTGELISAAEAHRLGLVNAVLSPERLMGAAEEVAARIADSSPSAVQQAKRAARMGVDMPLEHGIEIETETYQMMVDHPDRYEGVSAFNERRKPVFKDAC